MMLGNSFYTADILLPSGGTSIEKWAVLACDQYTSQPEYWQQVEEQTRAVPSTYHMILPEAYLEAPDVERRIAAVHEAMGRYTNEVLTENLRGFVYVERSVGGHVRQGLVGCVDLEDYSFAPGAAARIRPSENTVVERIPPRLAVRRGAALEAPHILMLIDDEACGVIEPLQAQKAGMKQLYSGSLMLGGGNITGWAVTNEVTIRHIQEKLAELEDPATFRKKYGEDAGSPFVMAVGDGNHSLATAKAWWDEIKGGLPLAQREGHPARYCLVEVENVRSPAIEIEPIHRVVFCDDNAEGLARAFEAFCLANGGEKGAGQAFGFVGSAGETRQLQFAGLPWPLAVGTLEAFLEHYGEGRPGMRVDYVHGEDSVIKLAARGAVGIILPPFAKGDLFLGVSRGGVLPKKTFSMGHANEKRYYLECRRIECREG